MHVGTGKDILYRYICIAGWAPARSSEFGWASVTSLYLYTNMSAFDGSRLRNDRKKDRTSYFTDPVFKQKVDREGKREEKRQAAWSRVEDWCLDF